MHFLLILVSISWHIIQDRVPAFSPKKAKDFIEKELGAPIDQLFREFEERPIAAASLGQVCFSFICPFYPFNANIEIPPPLLCE